MGGSLYRAPANAHPDVLARVDEVTAANDDDGVALAIERLLVRASTADSPGEERRSGVGSRAERLAGEACHLFGYSSRLCSIVLKLARPAPHLSASTAVSIAMDSRFG